ncbi:hypothetical protein AVEN_115527-1 [Araneus ventricosus]|uniref:Uncharacterized protein n=1 Tax=Araneus ventricosus TaxID=182803 RepID=A0A4Y2CLG5_ARAVE|nr:hypothetical protein AVEN_115527-1 [Araneus ventricosus]
MTTSDLSGMITSFEKTGQFEISPGRGRKFVGYVGLEDVAASIVEITPWFPVHNHESVAGAGFCAETTSRSCPIYIFDRVHAWRSRWPNHSLELSRTVLKRIVNYFGLVTWRVVILENFIAVSVHRIHEWLQIVSN